MASKIEFARHRVRIDCETLTGVPQCIGSAVYGPERCTCDNLSDEDHIQCIRDAWRAEMERNGEPCHDCAFRKGSPEQDIIDRIARQDAPFRCHQGMPFNASSVAQGGSVVDYCPQSPVGYPICAGWLRARESRRLRR